MTEQMKAIEICLDASLIPYLEAADGEGKSTFCVALADYRKAGCAIMLGNNMDPTDLGGAIFVDKNGDARRVPVHRAVREALIAQKEKREFIIVVDELTTTPLVVLATCLSLFSEGYAGDEKLDLRYIKFILAGNPADIAVNGNPLSPIIMSRLVKFEWKADFNFWCEGMQSGDWCPAEEGATVTSFLKWKGETDGNGGYFRVAPTSEYLGKTRPTPRSWTKAAIALHTARERGASRSITRMIMRGIVGEKVGQEFSDFLFLQELVPSPKEALANWETVEFPERSDLSYSFFLSLASYVSGTKKMEDWKTIWNLLERTKDTPSFDMACVAARMLAELRNTEAGRHLRKYSPPQVLMFKEAFVDLGLLGRDSK